MARRLQRNLGRLDIIFLTIAAVISIDTIGQIASSGGAQAFTWTAVIVLTFLVPYGLVMAELGSAFPQEGGPYVWVRLAFGRFWASLSTMFYWITNPVWLGGSLTFLAATTWSTYLVHTGEGTPGDYLFKLGFIWLAILSAVVSLRYGKWLLNVGAVLKVALVVGVRGHGRRLRGQARDPRVRGRELLSDHRAASSRSPRSSCSRWSASRRRTAPRRRCATRAATSRSRSRLPA